MLAEFLYFYSIYYLGGILVGSCPSMHKKFHLKQLPYQPKTLQKRQIRNVCGCEKFLPGLSWLLLSKMYIPYLPSTGFFSQGRAKLRIFCSAIALKSIFLSCASFLQVTSTIWPATQSFARLQQATSFER